MSKSVTKNFPRINIIFDFDGVIINSHKIKTQAFYEIFKSYGKNYGLLAKKFHLNNTGKSRYFKFQFILNNILKLKVTKRMIMNLDKEFDQFVKRKIIMMSPSCHLIRFLRNNRSSANIYISTGTPQKKIISILKEKKLLKYFKKVYGSPKSKIEHIREIKRNKKKCIFIGDSFEDYKAAKYTGTSFFLKINSENLLLRKEKNLETINSFKFLDKKIKLLN
tara:strand:+ start:767 stop:1429 length:663 start_codon:yes stop_codon:yes gene_type:complete